MMKEKQRILTFNSWNEQMFDIFFLQQDIEPQTSTADSSLCMNVVVKRFERCVDWKIAKEIQVHLSEMLQI